MWPELVVMLEIDIGAEPEPEGTDGARWRQWRKARRQCLWCLVVGVGLLHMVVVCKFRGREIYLVVMGCG
jgi:hypothetical protein